MNSDCQEKFCQVNKCWLINKISVDRAVYLDYFLLLLGSELEANQVQDGNQSANEPESFLFVAKDGVVKHNCKYRLHDTVLFFDKKA